MFNLTKKQVVAAVCAVFGIVVLSMLGSIGEDVKNETIVVNQFPFSGNMEYWTTVLFGRRFIIDNEGNPIKEVSRCTYLTNVLKEAKCYGDVVLEVEYNPFNKNGRIKKDKRGRPLNNYNPDSWQMRVYEPIMIDDVKLIETKGDGK